MKADGDVWVSLLGIKIKVERVPLDEYENGL
jgi:hypothetical protein